MKLFENLEKMKMMILFKKKKKLEEKYCKHIKFKMIT